MIGSCKLNTILINIDNIIIMKILTLLLIAFLSFSVTADHEGGVMVTPEVYGVKLIEIDFCQNASCQNAIKVGGGKRINIADTSLWGQGGTLVDLKNAPLLANTAYTHVRFKVDAQFVVKAQGQGCYTYPTKIEKGFSEGTTDISKYEEQVLWLDTSYLYDEPSITDIESKSFKYTHPLVGSYTKGTGQRIVWSVDASGTVAFKSAGGGECDIGVDGPDLVFAVVNN